MITTEETGTKGDKYYDGDRKMDSIWLKVRITTEETGTKGDKNYEQYD